MIENLLPKKGGDFMKFFISNINSCIYFPYRHAHVSGPCLEINTAGDNEYTRFKSLLYSRIDKIHVFGNSFSTPTTCPQQDNHVVFVVNDELVIEFSDWMIFVAPMSMLVVDKM